MVDPGLMMQGAPVSGSLRARGIEPHTTQGDPHPHALRPRQALIEFIQRETYVHEIELEAPYTALEQSMLDMVQVTS